MQTDWKAVLKAALLKLWQFGKDAGREALEETAKAAGNAALGPFVENGVPDSVEEELLEALGDSAQVETVLGIVDRAVKVKAGEYLADYLAWAETINPGDNEAA